MNKEHLHPDGRPYTQEEFINKIKTDSDFAKQWGELGPIYGKQWRQWKKRTTNSTINQPYSVGDRILPGKEIVDFEYIDQITNLVNELKTNPDSRRLMVSAWNVGELNQMVLPPCHYGFQVYTRELSLKERVSLFSKNVNGEHLMKYADMDGLDMWNEILNKHNIPTRAISLMWNQRSVDVPLGLPFNIASYGLLLHILAVATNMIPDELIGNLGDCHIYENQVDGIKEQMGRELSLEERLNMVSEEIQKEFSSGRVNLPNFPNTPVWSNEGKMSLLDDFGVPRRTREPYPLPTLKMNPIFLTNLEHKGLDEAINDQINFELENYQSHPSIKIPLSN